jgi:hypothetical protein
MISVFVQFIYLHWLGVINALSAIVVIMWIKRSYKKQIDLLQRKLNHVKINQYNSIF